MNEFDDIEDVFELWWGQRVDSLRPEDQIAPFWTIKVASFVVGKAPNTVRSWIDGERVQGLRIGGTLLVSVTSLKSYLRKCENARY